jgi:hypothetical protein
MWKNISSRLDQDAARRERRWQWLVRGAQWRPAMVLAVAAGFFWFALIPNLPPMDNMPGNTGTTPTSQASPNRGSQQTYGPRITRPAEDEPQPTTQTASATATATAPVKPYLHFPTVPQ